MQIVAGLRGTWKDWDWDGSFNYSQNTIKERPFQAGYDPSYYDPRARFVYGSVRYAFK